MKISKLPSALSLPSLSFSVEMSAFEVKTTKRPLALMSLILEVKNAVVLVSWTVNGSGVGLDVCAATETSEPPMSAGTMMAHRNKKTCFTNSSANKDTDTSRLDGLGELTGNKIGHFSRTRHVRKVG